MAHSEPIVELLYDAKALIGESPLYDEKSNQLLWVDIRRQTINFLDVDLQMNRSLNMPDTVGAIIQVEGSANKLVALIGKKICLVDSETGVIEKELATVDEDRPENGLNDGKCDKAGNLWCGSMERLTNEVGTKPDMPTPNSGAFFSYREGKVTEELPDLTVPNGLDWSPDGTKMYAIDTAPRKVYAFDYDETQGAISNQHVLVDYASNEYLGFPDGMTVDAKGQLWICGFYGPGVTCFDPQTGQQLSQVHIPVGNATSCCFGGPNFEWLFVTSACFATDKTEWKRYPHSGGIFAVKNLATRGVPGHTFKL